MSYKTAKKPILLHRGRNRKKRPKTFSSATVAAKYAEDHHLKKYVLKDLTPFREKKKIRIDQN